MRRREALLAGAMIAAVAACGTVQHATSFPPEASRRSPPEGIDELARTTSSPAPPLKLKSTLGDAELSATGRYLLVFYRGHW